MAADTAHDAPVIAIAETWLTKKQTMCRERRDAPSGQEQRKPRVRDDHPHPGMDRPCWIPVQIMHSERLSMRSHDANSAWTG